VKSWDNRSQKWKEKKGGKKKRLKEVFKLLEGAGWHQNRSDATMPKGKPRGGDREMQHIKKRGQMHQRGKLDV